MHRRMPLCEMNDVFAPQHLPHPLYIPLVSLKDLPAVSRASQQCFVAIGAMHEGGWHFAVSDDASGRFWLARIYSLSLITSELPSIGTLRTRLVDFPCVSKQDGPACGAQCCLQVCLTSCEA